MSRPLQPSLVRRWLLGLLALVTLQTLWLHIAPPRVTAQPIPTSGLPGEPLASLPAWSDGIQSGSVTLRRRLPGGHLLLLTNLASGTIEGFQVALLTRARPALHLQQRRLHTLPEGQIASGRIQAKPAAQTCLIGSRGAITAAALHELFPRERQFSPQWFAVLLGLRPPPILRCTLVTLQATEAPSGSLPTGQADISSELRVLLSGLPF